MCVICTILPRIASKNQIYLINKVVTLFSLPIVVFCKRWIYCYVSSSKIFECLRWFRLTREVFQARNYVISAVPINVNGALFFQKCVNSYLPTAHMNSFTNLRAKQFLNNDDDNYGVVSFRGLIIKINWRW